MATTSPQLDLPGVRARVLGIVRALLEELGSHGAIGDLSIHSNLDRDLGMGSLERVELLGRLEEAFGVRLPDTIAAEASTPEDLTRAILSAPGMPLQDEAEIADLREPADGKMRSGRADSIVESAQTLLEVIRYRGIHDANRVHLVLTDDEGDSERRGATDVWAVVHGGAEMRGGTGAAWRSRGRARFIDAANFARIFYLLCGSSAGGGHPGADLPAISRRPD